MFVVLCGWGFPTFNLFGLTIVILCFCNVVYAVIFVDLPVYVACLIWVLCCLMDLLVCLQGFVCYYLVLIAAMLFCVHLIVVVPRGNCFAEWLLVYCLLLEFLIFWSLLWMWLLLPFVGLVIRLVLLVWFVHLGLPICCKLFAAFWVVLIYFVCVCSCVLVVLHFGVFNVWIW